MIAATVLFTLLGCPAPRTASGPAPAPLPRDALYDEALGSDLPPGLSGLAWLPEGRLLAVSERGGSVVLLDPMRRRPSEVRAVRGVPSGLDLESVATVGGGRLAFGTESQDPRRSVDLVVLGSLGPEGVEIDQAIELSWVPFGMRPEANRGIEAVCSAGDTLVAVGEQVGIVRGQRYAPVWLRDHDGGPIRTARLLLSSSEGKISGVACRTGPDHALQLTAIERHFSTIRIVRWTLTGQDAEPVLPSAVKDLARALGSDPPNPEGLTLDPAGGMWLVSDNDYGGVDGPARLLRLAPE